MPKALDLVGKKFHRLYVESRAPNKNGDSMWNCICDCGNRCVIQGVKLVSGNTKSCGCYKMDLISALNRKHGKSKTRLYHIWENMRHRCSNNNLPNYSDYGGRGIAVCKEWNDSFDEFEKWSYQNGYDDSLSIDRIDNNKGYSPDNCRWATRLIQNRNQRSNHLIEYNGEIHTLTEWSEIKNIPRQCLSRRIIEGNWPLEIALNTPSNNRHKLPWLLKNANKI